MTLLRIATEAELPAIVALLADDDLGRGREDTGTPLAPAYLAGFRAIAADPNQELLVTGPEGAPTACLQLSYIPGVSRRGAWRGLIEGVRVSAGARGAGLGRAIILEAVERCRARGCSLVQLTSDASRTRAHAFYERLGFEGSHLGFKLTL
ncbi:GNAT family N-acetyltransferase [Paroceanicella profunda]|uniref:GNAT family N-acetyltransferase n=1 Tax=Paroceanicella profunda TaxID=2579971 RepID=A0A5B8G2Y9_9RHOB|nr:GNAT family N-acetyltransferase [Paroceanicella profunda]QDL93023.1 GNAT family N-acetyltransferase [Paroceanicella profunda]